MPLNPTFSITPLNPVSSEVDLVKGEYKHYAQLHCYGVFLHSITPWRLTNQYVQNKAVFLVSDPVATPAPATMPSDWYKRHAAWLSFKTNATPQNQYLLIYHLDSSGYGPKVAIYINGNLVRSEEVVGEQYISILGDCPPSQVPLYVYMLLEGGGILELKGIECYVL